MFRNQSVQVKLVKDNKSETEPAPPIDYVPIIREVAQDVVTGAAILIGVYMGCDTLRKVIIKLA